MSMPALILLLLIPLLGLTFIVLVGRRRRTSQGTVNTPAPGSSDSPLFGAPNNTRKKN
jgi:hypothetical protein